MKVHGEFDYVIVGGGSAGCVLAARLSEDPDVSVALVEAGDAASRLRHPFLSVPAAFFLYTGPTPLNWSYLSEPEPHAGGRRIPVPRGKALGGSSIINGMMYQRGHPRDYERWRESGLAGWGYADVLPYFRRAERSWRGEDTYHGGIGPVPVSLVDAATVGYEELRQAALAAGHADSDDHGRLPEGVGPTEMTVGRGRRADTASVYLQPAIQRPNLKVITRAHASRLIIERGRAIGVEVLRHGQKSRLAAAREIILAGGAYGSPQLLLLSGIGPPDELAKLGIEPVLDLPGVGRNLGEHPFIFLFNAADSSTFLSELRLDRALISMLRWLIAGTGPFATNVCRGSVFVRSRAALDRPDLQLLFPATSFDAMLWLPPFRDCPEHRLDCGISLLHFSSRGTVSLRSADPLDAPRIVFNLCREQADVDALVQGIRLTREIFAQEPLRSRVRRELVPGTECRTDEQLAGFVRENCAITHHPAGTCSMGTGAEAVVDAALRLRGIEGLRVADASAMPEPPGGNCNMCVIMLAEKAADLIRGRRLPPADV
jgi:choline dehydrogenase